MTKSQNKLLNFSILLLSINSNLASKLKSSSWGKQQPQVFGLANLFQFSQVLQVRLGQIWYCFFRQCCHLWTEVRLFVSDTVSVQVKINVSLFEPHFPLFEPHFPGRIVSILPVHPGHNDQVMRGASNHTSRFQYLRAAIGHTH